MRISRRTCLNAIGALPVAAAFPHQYAQAELKLGDTTLTTVSDGSLTLPASFIFASMPEAELAPLLQEFHLSKERLTPECNLALYRDGTNTVLFDVGAGPDFMTSAGQLSDSLDAMGLSAEEITHIVFTHAHPDHIWGLLDDFDDPAFPDATYMMGRTEWEYWWNPDTVQSIGEARIAFAVGAKRRMEAIEDQVTLFDGGEEILPGILAVSSPGHTPGHMSFEVRSGSSSALILGDAISNHHVAFRKPEWPSGTDQAPDLAAQSRKMLFDRITSENMAIAGFHLPNGGIGHVDKRADGYEFISQG